RPQKYPARQTFAASKFIADSHCVKRATFIIQEPFAIDSGAFHNDVVAVGNRNLLLYHQLAWINAPRRAEGLERILPGLRTIQVKESDVPLADAIATYLFNSQLVTLPDGIDALIAPIESKENPRVRAAIESLG